jgi:hypothetical protein
MLYGSADRPHAQVTGMGSPNFLEVAVYRWRMDNSFCLYNVDLLICVDGATTH